MDCTFFIEGKHEQSHATLGKKPSVCSTALYVLVFVNICSLSAHANCSSKACTLIIVQCCMIGLLESAPKLCLVI
uniref:Uncharacterized protein n=1 Tax=Arundo donax TaxID=35708 RepID=A0A0A9GFJ4_ARUDO